MFTLSQEKAAYKKLPPEIQDFIMDEDTAEMSERAIVSMQLDEDVGSKADSEILYAMFGMQTFETAINNIASMSGKAIEEIAKAVDELEKTTLEKYSEAGLDIEEFVSSNQTADKDILDIPPEIMAKQIKMPAEPIAKLPEVTLDDLPEIVPGQVAHDASPLTPKRSDGGRVPHIETTAAQPAVVVTPTPAPTPVSITKTAPSDASAMPQVAEVPSAPKSIMEEKLSQVTAAPRIDADNASQSSPKAPTYAPGKDPYREPLV